MKTFEKSSKLDNVLYDVRGPVVDEAARMEEDGMEILKLNIGNPYPFGFSAPQEVILDMLSNIRTSQGYSDSNIQNRLLSDKWFVKLRKNGSPL